MVPLFDFDSFAPVTGDGTAPDRYLDKRDRPAPPPGRDPVHRSVIHSSEVEVGPHWSALLISVSTQHPLSFLLLLFNQTNYVRQL